MKSTVADGINPIWPARTRLLLKAGTVAQRLEWQTGPQARSASSQKPEGDAERCTNVEGTVEDTKLIVTIDLAAITRDGHRQPPTDSCHLATIDPQAIAFLHSGRDRTSPVG